MPFLLYLLYLQIREFLNADNYGEKARGAEIDCAKNMDVRPRLTGFKESLFNIIGTKIIGARVLDMFAGTGNLGLESWSRGADAVTFVDEAGNRCAWYKATSLNAGRRLMFRFSKAAR